MVGDRKRFSVNFELSIYDNKGGGICGSNVRPSFRAETDDLSPDLEMELLAQINESIKNAFDHARKIALMQDHVTAVSRG